MANLQLLAREDVKIINDDPKQALNETIADYERRSGKPLQPAHYERLLINTYAYRETLVRQLINEAYRQNHPRYATGLALDICGDFFATPRLPNEDDEHYRERVLLAPEHLATTGTVGAYEYHTREVSNEIIDVDIANRVDERGQPIGGTVEVTILARDGMPSDELLETVLRHLRADKNRPIGDFITVRAPEKRTFSVEAELVILTSHQYQKAQILQRAEAQLRELLKQFERQLGKDIVPLELMSALKVDGVYDVKLRQHGQTRLKGYQWATCEAVNLTASSEVEDG